MMCDYHLGKENKTLGALELVMVNQAGLELAKILLPLLSHVLGLQA